MLKMVQSVDDEKLCIDDDVRVEVIGYGGLFRVFSFTS